MFAPDASAVQARAAPAGQRRRAGARHGRCDAVVEAASVASFGAGARLGRRGGGEAATEEPAEIVRWIDEIDDA
jgi:hypothetical protein